MRRLFEELGATYIKLGQFIASSPTLFPAEFVLEFQSCLDSTPTVPYKTINQIIQKELGKSIDEFSFIDPIPLATASVAQVHRAKLRNGTEVCIKVQKPGVDTTLIADLNFLTIV
jgi:predicted unusual protein kinase regulating ubiquinone biosynthesis (AarF/ABC1/UbiB family)